MAVEMTTSPPGTIRENSVLTTTEFNSLNSFHRPSVHSLSSTRFWEFSDPGMIECDAISVPKDTAISRQLAACSWQRTEDSKLNSEVRDQMSEVRGKADL